MNAQQMLGVLRHKHGEIQYDIERTQARLDRLLAERAECERDISGLEAHIERNILLTDRQH